MVNQPQVTWQAYQSFCQTKSFNQSHICLRIIIIIFNYYFYYFYWKCTSTIITVIRPTFIVVGAHGHHRCSYVTHVKSKKTKDD